MGELVSRAEYGRRRGVSHTAVNNHVKAGRIQLVEGKVDADTAWPGEQAAIEFTATGPVEGTKAAEELLTARAKRVIVEHRAAEIQGETVSVAEVKEALSEMVSRVRARLLMVPGKVGMRHGPVVQHEVESQIHAALQELSDDVAA